MSASGTAVGSNVTCAASAWPVVSVHTASYEGSANFPPEYPTSTFSTPRSSWNTGWRHQKQPPAMVTTSFVVFGVVIMPFTCGCASARDLALPTSFHQAACVRPEVLFLPPLGQRQGLQSLDLLADSRHPGTGPVGSEHDFVRDFFEPREPFEEPLRRDARGVEEHVRMPAQEVEGRVAPEGTTAMGHEDREVGEILGYGIQGDRVSVLRSRAGEDRGPRVDCDGHAESLGGLVNRAQGGQLAIRICIRREQLMGRMNFHPAHLPLGREALDVPLRIPRPFRMDGAKRNQAFPVLSGELGDEPVHVFGEAHDLRRDVVDQARPLDADRIEVGKERPRIVRQPRGLVLRGDRPPEGFQDLRLKGAVGLDVDVDVRDPGQCSGGSWAGGKAFSQPPAAVRDSTYLARFDHASGPERGGISLPPAKGARESVRGPGEVDVQSDEIGLGETPSQLRKEASYPAREIEMEAVAEVGHPRGRPSLDSAPTDVEPVAFLDDRISAFHEP